MRDLKEYLVTSDYGQWNNTWIVAAKNAKDAIQQVYDEYVKPMNEEIKQENKEAHWKFYRLCKKSELHARSLGSLHNEEGKIILVN